MLKLGRIFEKYTLRLKVEAESTLEISHCYKGNQITEVQVHSGRVQISAKLKVMQTSLSRSLVLNTSTSIDVSMVRKVHLDIVIVCNIKLSAILSLRMRGFQFIG